MTNFDQKFEPKGKKVLHGAGQSPETFKNYWDAVQQNKPIIYMTYIKFQSMDKWINRISDEIDPYPNIMLQIGLNFRIYKKDGTKDIFEGKHDETLMNFSNKLKSLNRKTFIRLGYEFDKKDRYKPKDYIKAFRYIIEFLNKEGHKNIAYVWCSCPYPGTEKFEPYYPGDEYVDWFGVDVFDPRFFNNYEPTNRFIKMAKEHNKPVMICESSAIKIGIENTEDIWNKWFIPYFKWVQEEPSIKAFCYINWDWGKDWKSPDWKNARIEENEEIRKKYIEELNNQIYINNK
jgi:hypothetical protein